MPYTTTEDRAPLSPGLEELGSRIHTVGDLNYVITRLAGQFLLRWGLSYSKISAVGGVLQDAADEYVARVKRPYEKMKIVQNGDIPEFMDVEKKIAEKGR